MIKKTFKLYNDYQDAKTQVAEQALNVFESKNTPLYFGLFIVPAVSLWLITIFLPEVFERLYKGFGLSLFNVLFIISYFAIFLGSKFIVKPTAEELSDDTSLFAIFSACRRKERRSFASIGLALLHTALFALYLLSQDM